MPLSYIANQQRNISDKVEDNSVEDIVNFQNEIKWKE